MEEAEAVCDRVAILVSGQLRWVTAPGWAAASSSSLTTALWPCFPAQEGAEVTVISSLFLPALQVHRLHPVPEEQVWQRISPGDQGQGCREH